MIAPGTSHQISPDGLYRRMCEIGHWPPNDGDYVRLAGMYGIGVGDMRHLINKLELIQRMEVEFMGKLDKEKAMELYKKGYSDGKIGELLGTSSGNVNFWRRSNQLPANCTSGGKPVKHPEPAVLKAADLVTMEKPEITATPAEENISMTTIQVTEFLSRSTCIPQKPPTIEDLQEIINRMDRQIIFLRGIAFGAGVENIDELLHELEK